MEARGISMEFKKLFQRGKIGTMELRNRIVVPPLNTGYAEGGQDRWRYTERHIRLLASWAKGGVGLIVQSHIKVESEIDKDGALNRYMVLDRDDWIGGLHLLTNTVHRYGAKIAVQLSAGCGRIAIPVPGHQPVGPSPNPHVLDPKLITRELTISEIERLVEAYGEAAARAQAAGFDAIHIHCLAQLFDQFLTPCWNKRTDTYGGDVEGRMRFVLECIESARSRVGSDFPLIVGMVSDHKISEGSTLEDTIKIAKRFEEVGVHALHLRAGGYDAPSWLVPPMYMEDGCSVPLAQPIREAVSIPVIVDGKIREPELAERLLEEGKADFVGIGRAMLADPEWPKKAREGKAEDIRKCIACNECVDRIHYWASLGCSVNPELEREDDCDIVFTSKPKKVLIIGGGPAGMETARVAALRGHRVSLYEKDDKLGGHLIEASAPPFKRDIKSLLDRLTTQLKKVRVKVELGKEATLETVLRLKPDVVIVATGGMPITPVIPGVDKKNVVNALDLLLGRREAGDSVVVVGGGHVGCETALQLAQQGKKITIVEILDGIARDMYSANRMHLLKLLTDADVKILTETKVLKITDEGITISDKYGKKNALAADTVVLALGLIANNKLYNELEGKVPELYAIGDSVKPRKIWEAIHEGFHVARQI